VDPRRGPQYPGAADTEDVVQDAVLGTFKRIERFEHRTVGALQAYLREAVINRIRDLVRSSRRRGLKVALDDDLPVHDPSPLELAIKREKADRFLQALQGLSPGRSDRLADRTRRLGRRDRRPAGEVEGRRRHDRVEGGAAFDQDHARRALRGDRRTNAR
jgi:RNA polymerase sigma factor (sigma-70 family)